MTKLNRIPQVSGFLILFFVVLACAGSNNSKRESPQKSYETPDRKLQAQVQLSKVGVIVKNTDSIDFPSLKLKLNLAQTGSDDGRADIGALPQGKTVTIPYGEFTVGTTRFNPRVTKILTIYLKSGDGSYKLFLCPGTMCQPAQ